MNAGLLLLMLVFGGISFQSVVKTIPSPNNTYTVRVISDNQGALGGATILETVENGKEFSILIGKFDKRPREIYHGGWDEAVTLDIVWQDDHTLLVDGVRHTMK